MGECITEVDDEGLPWIREPEWGALGLQLIENGYPGSLSLEIGVGDARVEWIADDELLSDPQKFERAKLGIIQGIEAGIVEAKPSPLALAALEGLKDALRSWKLPESRGE